MLKEIPLFAALTRQMDWLGARQKVLARNIANADTPGYQASDLKQLEFRELVQGPNQAMRTTKTSARHIAPPGEADDSYSREREKEGYESSPSSNSVVLEEEIMKVNETRMSYDMATSLYRKHIQMLKMAIGGRQG